MERAMQDTKREVSVTEQLPRASWQSKYLIRFLSNGREVGCSFANTKWGVRREERRFKWGPA